LPIKGSGFVFACKTTTKKAEFDGVNFDAVAQEEAGISNLTLLLAWWLERLVLFVGNNKK
jgi:hypothetical protein